MWKKIKKEFKGFWKNIKTAAFIGLALDIILGFFDRKNYFPFFTLFIPFLYISAIIFWGIILWGIFPLIVKFINLIPNWLINITPKWLRRLLNSSTFWVWVWSIGSLLLMFLLLKK